MVTFIFGSTPACFNARSAATMMTSPPFISITPGPRAVESSSRSNRWNGLLGSNTVSRWPMSRSFGPGPGCSATRWPERLNGAPSTHRVVKPSESSSARSTSATRRTPAKFIVPLLMSTMRWRSARARALSASTYRTTARSSTDRAAAGCARSDGDIAQAARRARLGASGDRRMPSSYRDVPRPAPRAPRPAPRLLDLSRRVASDEDRPSEGIRHLMLQDRIAHCERVHPIPVLDGAASADRNWYRSILLRRLRHLGECLRAVAGHHPAQCPERLSKLQRARLVVRRREAVYGPQCRIMLHGEHEHLDGIADRRRPAERLRVMRSGARGAAIEGVDQREAVVRPTDQAVDAHRVLAGQNRGVRAGGLLVPALVHEGVAELETVERLLLLARACAHRLQQRDARFVGASLIEQRRGLVADRIAHGRAGALCRGGSGHRYRRHHRNRCTTPSSEHLNLHGLLRSRFCQSTRPLHGSRQEAQLRVDQRLARSYVRGALGPEISHVSKCFP